MTDTEREQIIDVLVAAGIGAEDLVWMIASCPSLAHATAEAQRRWRKRVEERRSR